MINEKDLVKAMVKKPEHMMMKPIETDIVNLVRGVMKMAAEEVEQGETVGFKNFGTFKLMNRIKRRRYDRRLKMAVETDPIPIIEFNQSPNVFRKDEQKEE